MGRKGLTMGVAAATIFLMMLINPQTAQAGGHSVDVGFRAGDFHIRFHSGRFHGQPRFRYHCPRVIVERRPRFMIEVPCYHYYGPPVIVKRIAIEEQRISEVEKREREIERALIDLRYGDKGDRKDAAKKLGKLRAEEGTRPLIRALEGDRKEDVRKEAAKALGKIGDPRAIPALERAARRDPEDDVRKAARKALKEFYEDD